MAGFQEGHWLTSAKGNILEGYGIPHRFQRFAGKPDVERVPGIQGARTDHTTSAGLNQPYP